MKAFFRWIRGIPKPLLVTIAVFLVILQPILMVFGMGFTQAAVATFGVAATIWLTLALIYCVLLKYKVRGSLAAGALAILVISMLVHYVPWESTSPYLRTIITLVLIGLLIVAAAYGYSKAGTHKDHIKKWFGDNAIVLAIGLMLPLILIAFFGLEGLLFVLTPQFLLLWAICIALATLFGKGFVLVPLAVALLSIFYMRGIHDMTLEQGGTSFASMFRTGEQKAGEGIANDINTAKTFYNALKPGAGISNETTRWPQEQYIVIAVPGTGSGFVNKGLDFVNSPPMLNVPYAPYKGVQVSGFEKPLESKAAGPKPVTVAKLPPPPTYKIRPTSTLAVGQKPLPDDACIRAIEGEPQIWHNAANSKVPIFNTWTKVAYYRDVYRWGEGGHATPLRKTQNVEAEVEVATGRCP